MSSRIGPEKRIPPIVQDLDSLHGTYFLEIARWDSSSTPSPSSVLSSGDGLVFAWSNGGYGTQFAIARASAHIAVRTYVSGFWSAWELLA